MTIACRTFTWRASLMLCIFLATATPNQRATAFSGHISARGREGGVATGGSRSRPGPREKHGGVIRGEAGRWTSRRPRATSFRAFPPAGSTRLAMVVTNPMDAPTKRATIPAERGINAGMEGFNAGVVNFLKGLMVQYYGKRTYARFYALETIARVPYFGYLCVLHLYETLGQWRQAEYLKVHFAESYNELHHLLIMEELGGNQLFWDRWFAQHAAFFYFFVVVLLYLSNPRNAYNLNQHVEEHAFSTYDDFITNHEAELKTQPAPLIAKKYYGTDKLYVFNGLHNDPDGPTFEERDLARPVISNLFDTFVAVRNDEWEHVKTMKALQEDVPSEKGSS